MGERVTKLLAELAKIVSSEPRVASLEKIAGSIKTYGDYRWVGLYDVDRRCGVVTNIVWTGPQAPAYLTFPHFQGF
jgi:hypothetical protein